MNSIDIEQLVKDRDHWRSNAQFEHRRWFDQLQYVERVEHRAEGWRRQIEALEQELQNTRISESRIRQLLQLCHPDKHGNSEASNDVTTWLLELRQRSTSL